MIHAFTGDTLTTFITITDASGTPLTGLSWNVVLTKNPRGETFGVKVTELREGVYRVEAPTTTESPTGEWYVLLEAEGTGRRFAETFDVNRKTSSYFSGVYIDSPTGLSLAEIRRMVARNLNDYRAVEASGGSTTTVTDVFNLVENTDHFRGAEIICTRGHDANLGAKRKVVSSSYESGTVTFIPELPEPVQPEDRFDIFNFGRVPHTISDYNDAINEAILFGYPQNREKLYVEAPESYVRISDGIEIPDEFTHVYAVRYQYHWGKWQDVRPARFEGDHGWFVNRAKRTIVLGYGYARDAENKPFRIYGYGRPATLTDDTDRTSTDIEWILDTAVANLITSSLDQASFPIGQSRANRADQLRGKMVKTPEPNTVSLE